MTGDELIGTSIPAPRQAEMALSSWQSWDYYNGNPYPTHAFGPTQWALDKGPRPTALPYCETLINEGAEFVFRNGAPTFGVADDPDAEELIQNIIRWNRLGELWIPLAENNGNQGALAAKFSVDLDDKDCPIRITFLDIPQSCRVWIDPHDRTRILMARIQYPYRDLKEGKWYFYREEWTDQSYVTYQPKLAGDGTISSPMSLPSYRTSLGDEGHWDIEDTVENPFGLIPVTVIRNKAEAGNPLGVGDCWRVFRIIDRLALTMHGEDRANQMHSEPIPVVKNAELDNDGPLAPGEPISVRNENKDGPAADFALLEPHGRAREYTHATIDKWERLLYQAAGLSLVNPAEVTNKGNMTALAFAMTFARTISTSDLKRELWGRSGMCVFFKNLMIALQRLGGVKEVKKITPDTEVSVTWPPYFEQTDQDRADLTNRTIDQMESGLLTQPRAAERIARAEKMPADEIQTLLEELRVQREQAIKAAQRAVSQDSLEEQGAPQTPGELAAISAASGVNNFTA